VFDRFSVTTCHPRGSQPSEYPCVVNITHPLFALSHIVDPPKTITMAVRRIGAKVERKVQGAKEKVKDILRPHTSDAGGNPKARRALGISKSVGKLTLKAVKEFSDAFPPLQSVASALDFIWTNVEVRKYVLGSSNSPHNISWIACW
jgi:hypothetical protein